MLSSKNLNSKQSARDAAHIGLKLLTTLLTSACAMTVALPAFCAEKSEPGYDYEQKSLMIGDVTVRICSKAVQVTDHGKGIVYVSRAPDWKLLMINAKEKTYFEGKIEGFTSNLARGVTLFTGRMLTDATYQAPTKQPDGLLLYTTNAEYLKRATENKKNVTNSNGNPKTIDVWTNPAVPAPPRAVALLGKLFGFAPAPGFPVRVRYFDFDHEEKVYLKTYKSSRKELTDNDFEKRQLSYKQVATSTAIFRSKEQDEEVSEMLGGFDDGLASKRKR